MKLPLLLGAAAIATVALISSKSSVQGTQDDRFDPTVEVVNPVVELPIELVHAQPFELATPERHTWRVEQPSFSSGLVLVLEADPAGLMPRQVAEPVLYVGDQTAQRINTGVPSGQLVVLVPDLTLADLADAPIFFGTAMLPEQVDAATIAAELNAARSLGVDGPGAARVGQVTDATVYSALDLDDLFFQVSYLIEEFSPMERDLIEGFRVTRYSFK